MKTIARFAESVAWCGKVEQLFDRWSRRKDSNNHTNMRPQEQNPLPTVKVTDKVVLHVDTSRASSLAVSFDPLFQKSTQR